MLRNIIKVLFERFLSVDMLTVNSERFTGIDNYPEVSENDSVISIMYEREAEE